MRRRFIGTCLTRRRRVEEASSVGDGNARAAMANLLVPRARSEDLAQLLAGQLAAGQGAAAAIAPPSRAAPREYASNAALWRDVLSEGVWASAPVTLRSFWIS